MPDLEDKTATFVQPQPGAGGMEVLAVSFAFLDRVPRSARVLRRANELLFAFARPLALRLRHYPVRAVDPY